MSGKNVTASARADETGATARRRRPQLARTLRRAVALLGAAADEDRRRGAGRAPARHPTVGSALWGMQTAITRSRTSLAVFTLGMLLVPVLTIALAAVIG